MTRKHTNNRMQENPMKRNEKNKKKKKTKKTKQKKPKNEWINNMTKELDGLEEGPKAELHIDLLKTILNDTKKISNWKTPGNDEIHGF